MSVRAKFVCTHNDEPLYLKIGREEYPQSRAEPQRVINFRAVTATDGDNESWSKWTPSGELQMHVTNPDAFEQFEVGKHYLLTFEQA